MNPHAAQVAYQQQQAGSWTRIDMLLALYRRAEETLAQMLVEPAAGLPTLKLRMVRLLLGIRQGLDFDFGELPSNVERLCEFVQRQVIDGGAEQWAAAARILTTLREGFEAIRDEAAELERNGAIPTAADDTSWQRLA